MIRFGFIPFVLFLLVIGCKNTNSDNPVNPAKTGYPVPDSNGNISARLGDTIEIKILNSSYDGGYSWNISTNFDSTIARFISYKTVYTGDPGMEGAPTYEIWHYFAVKKGSSTLQMKSFRVFEPASIIGNKSYFLTVAG